MLNPIFTKRKFLYRRLADGMIVQCGDWPDGDTSWLLNSIPLISSKRIAGTMKTEIFDRLHEPTEHPA